MRRHPINAALLALACALTLAPQAVAQEKSKPSPIKLYGQIDELGMYCSSAGIRLTGSALPAKIAKVSLGSAAAYSGVREGDKVLGARPDGMQLVLDIDRNGKRYQASIATDIHGLKEQFEKRGLKWSLGDTPFDKDLEEIAKCNIVVLLDRSESMMDTHAGCPGNLSKWAWCKQQLDGLYFATSRLLDEGFDLVPFNNTHQRWNNVTLWDLKMVFDRTKPQGKVKDIGTPLESVIEDRLHWKVHATKPMIIVVLTDGMQNSGRPLENVLIEASQKVKDPREITVVFLQVGNSVLGEELFDDLDQNLVAKGARYHMVSYKPFSELRQKGLLFEVMSSVKQTLGGGIKAPGSL